jgi:hypothetical protein
MSPRDTEMVNSVSTFQNPNLMPLNHQSGSFGAGKSVENILTEVSIAKMLTTSGRDISKKHYTDISQCEIQVTTSDDHVQPGVVGSVMFLNRYILWRLEMQQN